jgi:hypothetical protein
MVLGRVDGPTGLTTDAGIATLTLTAIDATWQVSGTATRDAGVATITLQSTDIVTQQSRFADAVTMTLTATDATYSLGTATRDAGVATITLSAIDTNYSSPTLSFTPVALLMQGAY